ncbi:S8 family serine peptidase (plasmid) [Arsenophonus sp. aPb]|uniref:S8 family serine peptidase n=1 Tax=Arsenophonus sp. aPb TaxID=3041619 RepID=UPI00246868ED|nr:S8 family serine peptidase [Arsenophonus sp. aPb]WGL99855.1 S8 family serine peptidase [Arsenophonus sp. aPb]
MEKHNIVIKFNREVIRSRNNQELILKSVATQDNFLTQFNFKSIVTDEMLLPQNRINTVNFENLAGICYVQNTDNMSLEEKESLAQKISTYDFVEYAYVEKLAPMELPYNPQVNNKEPLINKTVHNTPNFTHLQEYKSGVTSTHIGIDMEYAWSLGIAGQGISIADIEWGFNFDHINLKRHNFVDYVPTTNPLNNEHGTAVAGVMYAKDINFGVKGMVHDAESFYGISEISYGRAAGISLGLRALRAGDIFVYEMQTGGITGKYVPADFDYAVWDVTQEALNAGIIVIGAAGNGSENLDQDIYYEYRNRPDRGVIRVGAGDELLKKANFSTYGSMVHVQGWGGNVVTTGYDGLYNGGPNNNYTNGFNGTSSATPIVASAAVAIQSWYKQQTGQVLTPREMRALLIETGTPQNINVSEGNEHIGPLPNVRSAITEMRRRLLEVVAIIEGQLSAKGGAQVMLSAEKSTSKVANIVAYAWQLPDGITAEIQNQSTLHFITPEVFKEKIYPITLTVTDAFGNSDSINHNFMVFNEFPLWERNGHYRKGAKVSWKNKKWVAISNNRGWEPGDDSGYWREVTDYPLWEPTKLYMVGNKVSWKNKKWVAINNNRGWEPSDNSEFWREIL